MKRLILAVSTISLLLVGALFFIFSPEIKRINKYSPDIISDVAFLMEPIDWHQFQDQHPKRTY